MKMSSWLMYLIFSLVITLLAVLFEPNNPRKDKKVFGVKIFIISFITLYVGNMLIGSDCDIKHEIDTGEPPF